MSDQAAALLAEAKGLSEGDRVDEAAGKAYEALLKFREAGDGLGQASALSSLMKLQIIRRETTSEKAISDVKDEFNNLPKVGSKKAEAELSLAMAEIFLAVGEFDKALQAALEAQSGFNKEEDALKESEALSKAVVPGYIGNSNEEKALAAANEALKLAQGAGDKQATANAWFAVAVARFEGGSFSDAMEAGGKALQSFRDLGDKFKESEAQCFLAQGYLASGDSQGALSAGKDALALAKDIGSGVQTGAAVEAIVEANISNDTPQDGLSAAEEELAALQANGKSAGVAAVMGAVVVAKTAVSGADASLSAVKGFVEACRASGNLKGEVAMLHRMACMAEHEEVAMNTAQAALKLAQQIGDESQELKIKYTLTDLWVARGKLHKAPTRRQALSLLNELTAALEQRDGEKFEETQKRLNKHMGALAATDFEATIYKVVAKNPDSAMAFLKEHGMLAEEKVKKEGPITGHKFRPVPVPNLYFGFRVSGLGYGPRYRCCVPANKILHEGGGAMGIVDLQDCSDDWERELGYSPSLLDGCLQTGAAMGH